MASKFLPIHDPSRKKARELCKNCCSNLERWQTITEYVTRNFSYDYIRAILIPKKNGLPDIDRCWKRRMGICLDIASMTVGMLKAVGINAYLIVGFADKKYHAWVEATISGKNYYYDHSNPKGTKVKEYQTTGLFE